QNKRGAAAVPRRQPDRSRIGAPCAGGGASLTDAPMSPVVHRPVSGGQEGQVRETERCAGHRRSVRGSEHYFDFFSGTALSSGGRAAAKLGGGKSSDKSLMKASSLRRPLFSGSNRSKSVSAAPSSCS